MYTLQPKPLPNAYINWGLAPASLVGCEPLIQGEDPVTTFEYVTRLAGDPSTFVPNTFGATTWQSWGVNMSGGGVAGARAVAMSQTAMATMDPHRRTIAWAQRALGDVLDTSHLFNGSNGVFTHFTVRAPGNPSIDPDPLILLTFGIRTAPPTAGTDYLTAAAPSSLINIWHSIMVSWSDGTGIDPAAGMAIWCDGVLLASKGTHINPASPGGPPDLIRIDGAGGAPLADFEYFYEFNEFIPSGNDLALKLYNDPYYFFKWPQRPVRSRAWILG